MITPKTAYSFKFLNHRPTKFGMSTENEYFYKAIFGIYLHFDSLKSGSKVKAVSLCLITVFNPLSFEKGEKCFHFKFYGIMLPDQ